MKFIVTGYEFLKRRNKPSSPCMDDIREYDQFLLGQHHQNVGCKAPYQMENFNPTLKLCETKEEMRRVQFPFNLETIRRFTPPCNTIQKLYYTYEDMELEGTMWDTKGLFWIGLYLPDTHYKEIIQSRYRRTSIKKL